MGYDRLVPVLLRVEPTQLARVRILSRELDSHQAKVFRTLLDEALTARRDVSDNRRTEPANELDLHLLVGIEQVIALIESFLPEGPGAAQRILPEAVLAAQRRIELAAGEE